jgi:uncharacterized membrane protein
MTGPSHLDRIVEGVLTGGLALSALLLLAGLLAGNNRALLWAGVLVLLLTPAARVVVVTVAFLQQRDWVFALVSIWILGVLASSFYLAWRLEAPRARAAPAAAAAGP